MGVARHSQTVPLSRIADQHAADANHHQDEIKEQQPMTRNRDSFRGWR